MNDKKLSEINYQPLSYMSGVWSATVQEIFKIPIQLFVIIVVTISLFISYFSNIMIGLYIGVLVVIYVSYKVLDRKKKIWKQFAEVNGWVIAQAVPNDPTYIPPGLYGVGHEPKLGDIVQATFEGHTCDIYMYQFTTGSGKNSRKHYYSIARVGLDRPFPHLVLDSKHSMTLRSTDFTKSSVKLEGDFNKHFSLYFEKNGHINALSIITPDVMQTLLDFNTAQDIEIVGQNLYFLIDKDTRDASILPILFESVDRLADEIKHKARTIQYKPEISEQQRLIAQIASQHGKSTDKAVSEITATIVIIVLLPIIIIILVGLFTVFFGNS